jgi:hypothetical protein
MALLLQPGAAVTGAAGATVTVAADPAGITAAAGPTVPGAAVWLPDDVWAGVAVVGINSLASDELVV